MDSRLFISAIFTVLTAVVAVFFHFKLHFSGADYFRAKAATLAEEIKQEKTRSLLVQFQLNDLKQQVSMSLPEVEITGKSLAEQYQQRNLASIVNTPIDDKFESYRADRIFAKGKGEFEAGNYVAANEHFYRLIKDFPSSIFVIKAHLLMVEGYFHLNKPEEVVRYVEQMISLFPDDELTGFALLRLANVYVGEDRSEDALEVYEVVQKNYKSQALLDQVVKEKKALR